MTRKKSARRFQNLLLYVAKKTEKDSRCGRTKLYKILFYSDFAAYQKLGSSISGQIYHRLEHGPAPKQALPVITAMEAEHLCAWAVRDFHGHTQHKLIALREPNLEEFTGEEIAIVDEVIDKLWVYTGADLSDFSHRFIGWQLADENEDIPYSTVALAEPRPPTPREVKYGRRLALGR